ATLTITSSPDSAIGEVPFAVQATSGTVTQTAAATVAVIDRDFAISTDKTSTTLGIGGSAEVRVTISPLFGASEVVIFSASLLSRGVQAWFDPVYTRVGESTTLQLRSAPFLSPGQSNVKITATGTLTSHSAVISLRTLFQPLATILDPTPYSHISGIKRVAVTGGASLGTTLKSIELYLDGQKIPGLVAQTSPAQLMWNTESANDGPHLLTARATDAEGNQGSSPGVAIWIENKGECGCSANGGGWEAIGLLGLLAAIRRRR
ncbi:MAG TPA: Ig-like domain-containing protein, partial [Myxococcales bacterium]|nr:Ig-like domain-containing protein [Myxococcales bacterium]